MPSNPRCFVALAVGPDDTEAFYDRLVKPVLDRNHITPVVISRRESNDDLNKQIVEQLGTCHVCIADLTYARPSVYFEAAYAQRQIPVIYTVRKDHLGENQPEDKRVHFDLAMKPLIKWSKPTDAGFRKRLERRLRATFLKEWRRQQEVDERLDRARKDFGGLPIKQRLTLLLNAAMATLKRRGFRTWERVEGSDPYVVSHLPNAFRSTFRGPNRLSVVLVHALHSPTKTQLERLAQLTSGVHLMYSVEEGKVPPRRGAVHTFVLPLQPVTASRLETVLPDYYPGQPPGHYFRRDSVPITMPRHGRGLMPFIATLDCISDIKSAGEFQAALDQRVSYLGEMRER